MLFLSFFYIYVLKKDQNGLIFLDFIKNCPEYSDISIRYDTDTGYLAFRNPVSGEWIDSYIQLSEFVKFNALATLSGDWERSGKASVSQSASSIHITYAGEYAAGNKGSYTYKKAIKLSNQQTISVRATLNNDTYYAGTALHICYKQEYTNWTLLKTLIGRIDGKNITYNATFPVSGNVNIKLEYAVESLNCPVDISITKFTIE